MVMIKLRLTNVDDGGGDDDDDNDNVAVDTEDENKVGFVAHSKPTLSNILKAIR